jgi:hypothetical protein
MGHFKQEICRKAIRRQGMARISKSRSRGIKNAGHYKSNQIKPKQYISIK